MSLASQDPITFPEMGKDQIRELERMLDLGTPELVSPSGERMLISPEIFEALRKMAGLMAEGKRVTVLPCNSVVTTQRAADIMGFSRPYFIKMLEDGELAHHRVGNQRRIYLRDVLAYRKKREAECQAALDRMTVEAYEAGLYDRNVMPEGGTD